MDIALLTWNDLIGQLLRFGNRQHRTVIEPEDVFRIVRMTYHDNCLLIFFTGYVSSDPTKIFQFYMETKCDLYSYRRCYNVHTNNECRYKCKSYKTFVMPGLRGSYNERINIVHYKRTPGEHDRNNNKNCLDSFLKDINRVHMQTDLMEGNYVQFKQRQCVTDHRLCLQSNDNTFKNIFTVIDPDSLKREIVPVIACYDIETHSDGQRFSSATVDNIISISIVVRRDGVDKRICLYYMDDTAKDIKWNTDNDAINAAEIWAVHFKKESDMLKAFFSLFPLLNMDFLLDYNGDRFDLPFILERVKRLNSGKEIVIKRYDLSPVAIKTEQLCDKFQNKINTHYFTYYVHVDLYQFLSSDSEQNDVENFQLNTVAKHYLNMQKVDLKITDMLRRYNEKLMKDIIVYNVQDCVLPIDLFLKLEIMDFMYTQCMLLYLCTDDVLRNISHKVNVVLFHKALINTRYDEKRNCTVPEPYFFNKHDLSVTSGRKRNAAGDSVDDQQMVDLSLLQRRPVPVDMIPSNAVKLCGKRQRCVYKGGKVLEPQPGFKQWVVTLDFNSLYLSIMMYEGICLSNVFVAQDDNVYLHKDLDAVNPKLLRELLDLRAKYKNRRDKHEPGTFQYNLNDKIQNAVKRIANSIYGYFGIFFKPLANYITKIGREKLTEAIVRIQAMSNRADILKDFNLSRINFRVIYGDTDSSFIQVDFEKTDIPVKDQHNTIKTIVNDYVLKTLNSSWNGYKMALENVMLSLILLKKKKYCYLNSEQRIKYKGWLVKKDMPLFMRKSFRQVVDSYLHGHSLACGLALLTKLMTEYYDNFGVNNNYNEYGFSMTYNENSTSAKKRKTTTVSTSTRPNVLTIAKKCYEDLKGSGTDFLPTNGDRIPYVLIDVEGSVTQKAFPLKLFDSSYNTINWIKHMGILCTFFNELIEVFGDSETFQYYFDQITSVFMAQQRYDVKYPVLVTINSKKLQTADDSDDDSDDKESNIDDANQCKPIPNHTTKFALHKRQKSKMTKSMIIDNECFVCKSAVC